MSKNAPMKRWKNGRLILKIDLAYLAVGTFVAPLALAATFAAITGIVGWLLRGVPFRVEPVFGFWIAAQLIAIPAAVMVALTKLHHELESYHANILERGYEPATLPIITRLYRNPKEEYLVFAVGTQVLRALIAAAGLIGGLIYAGSVVDPVVGENALASTLGNLSAVLFAALALAINLQIFDFLLAMVLLLIGALAGPMLAGFLGPVPSNIYLYALGPFVAGGLFAIGQRHSNPGFDSAYMDKQEKQAAGNGHGVASFYGWLGIKGGTLLRWSVTGGGWWKTTKAITLATDKTQFAEPDEWEIVGDVARGQRLDSTEARARLEAIA